MSKNIKLTIGLIMSLFVSKFDIGEKILSYIPDLGIVPIQLLLSFTLFTIGEVASIVFLIALIKNLLSRKPSLPSTNNNIVANPAINPVATSNFTSLTPPPKKRMPRVVFLMLIIGFCGIILPITLTIVHSIMTNSNGPQYAIGQIHEGLFLLGMLLIFPIIGLSIAIFVIVALVKAIGKNS